MRCWWWLISQWELCRSATYAGAMDPPTGVPAPFSPLLTGFLPSRDVVLTPSVLEAQPGSPLCWHSTSNGIEEPAASSRRDLGGLRFQEGFGAGA